MFTTIAKIAFLCNIRNESRIDQVIIQHKQLSSNNFPITSRLFMSIENKADGLVYLNTVLTTLKFA